MIKFFRCLRENYYFIGKSLSLSNSGYIGDFFYWCLIKDSHIGFRSPFRGFRFAQPPAIESLSLSGASHPTPSECSRCVVGTISVDCQISTGNIASLSGASHPIPSECSRYVIGTTSDVRRISTGNIVSFLSVRVFADAVSVGFAFRGFRFAQPPVIESLRSPVRRTTLLSEFHAICRSKKVLYSLDTLNSKPSILNSTLYILHSQFFSLHLRLFAPHSPPHTLHSPLSYGQVRSIQKRRLAFLFCQSVALSLARSL